MTHLLALLKRHKPVLVVATLADGERRELRPPSDSRKRWEPIVALVEQLAPELVELYGGAGELLARVQGEPLADDLLDEGDAPSVPALDAAADRYLQRLVAAQREALSWQDKSVRTALDAVVAVMQQLGSSIAAISRAHDYEREQLRALVAEAREAAPAEGEQQSQILAQLAPVIAAKLLAPPTAPPAPPRPSPVPPAVNGTPKK